MNKKVRDAWRFLAPLISPWDFGWKWDGGIARPTKADVIEAFNARRHGRYKWTLKKMTAHFSGDRTLYFAADGRAGTKLVLGMFDVDCHKLGRLKYALAFAEHLKRFFPTLYVEPSTNRKGVHGYFLLEKGGFGDRYVRTFFAHIQVWVEDEYDRWQAVNPDKPIDGVEIKGSPARLKWSPDGCLEDMTMGTLAKLPRQVVDRLDEFKATARISIKTLKELLGQVVLGEGLTGKFVRERLGRPRASAVVASVPISSKQAAIRGGSTAGHPVDGRYLQRLPIYRQVAESLMEGPIPTSGRAVASVEDVAVFVMLLVAFTNNPNVDGSMPTKRFKAVWESMHERGEVDRPWNPNRFTAIRNHLTRLSMIQWIDGRYVEGFVGDDGEYVKGRAAKWAAGRSLVESIEQTIGEQEEERGEKEEHLGYNKGDRSSVITMTPSRDERSESADDTKGESPTPILHLFDTSFVFELRREHFVKPTRSLELWSERRLAA